MQQRAAEPHVTVVDGFRGMAILMVVLYHIFEKSHFAFGLDPLGIQIDFHTIPQAGFLGVQVFFFVSGFCIFYPYAGFLAGLRPLQSTATFVSRRFWKIFPSYFVALTALALFYPFDNQPGIGAQLDYVLHLFFVHSFNDASFTSINGNFWSLATEVQYYALFALALPLLLRRPLATTIAFGAAAVAFRLWMGSGHVLDGIFQWEYSLPAFLDLFAAGMLCAYLYTRLRDARLPPFAKEAATGISIVCAILFLLLLETVNRTTGGPAAWQWQNANNVWMAALLSLILLGALFGVGWWQRLIANRPLRWLSFVSYNVYLWNAPVLHWFSEHQFVAVQGAWNPWVFAAAGFTLCIAAGAFFTYAFEQPLLRWATGRDRTHSAAAPQMPQMPQTPPAAPAPRPAPAPQPPQASDAKGSKRAPALLALGLVLLLGMGLRLYAIDTNPPELFYDELNLYNAAYSIATTGHDLDGELHPFLFGGYTRTPPIYAAAGYASSLLFGNGPFGLRLPAVVFGTISILLIYGIAFELTRRRDVAVVAALLQAVLPIFVHFSRIAWEPASELPFLLAGLYVLLRAFRTAGERGAAVPFWSLALGAGLLGLTSYTYMSGWFYAALLGGTLLLFNARRFGAPQERRKLFGSLALGAFIAAPALWTWFTDPATVERTARIATFASGFTWTNLQIFASNYAAHFRWSYLVTTGDPQPGMTWKYMAGFGAFYWWVVPLAVAGLILAGRYVRSRSNVAWLWVWILAYPLGGALTNEGVPNASRTLAGAPAFCLLAAFGWSALVDAVRTQTPKLRSAAPAMQALLAANALLSTCLFAGFYFTQYPRLNPNAWDSGTRELFTQIRTHQTGYTRLCFAVRQAWFALDTYERYYLARDPIRVIIGANDPACFMPGTLLATDEPVTRPGFAPIAAVRDVSGAPFAALAGRPVTIRPRRPFRT